MSEEVAVTTSEPLPVPEIIPAKSEDKLEIEKEEAEQKESEQTKESVEGKGFFNKLPKEYHLEI